MERDFVVPEGHVLVRRNPNHGSVYLPLYGRLVTAGTLWHLPEWEAKAHAADHGDWEVVPDDDVRVVPVPAWQAVSEPEDEE